MRHQHLQLEHDIAIDTSYYAAWKAFLSVTNDTRLKKEQYLIQILETTYNYEIYLSTRDYHSIKINVILFAPGKLGRWIWQVKDQTWCTSEESEATVRRTTGFTYRKRTPATGATTGQLSEAYKIKKESAHVWFNFWASEKGEIT